jgi:hypothetical protein
MGCDFLPFWPSLAGLSESSTTGGPAIIIAGSAQSNSAFDIDPRVRISGMTGAAHQPNIRGIAANQS